MAEESGGRWVTMDGQHIFIKDGESPMSAFLRTKGQKIANKIKNNFSKDENKKVNTNIMSIKKLKEEISNGNIDKKAKVILSTSSDDEKLTGIKNNNKLILRYDDIKEGKRAYNEKMANEVVKFMKKIKNDEEVFVVCDYGQSRSTAIASAINKKFNKDDSKIWSNPNYSPNSTVYKNTLKAFGINLSDEELNKKKELNNNALREAIRKSRSK